MLVRFRYLRAAFSAFVCGRGEVGVFCHQFFCFEFAPLRHSAQPTVGICHMELFWKYENFLHLL